MTHHNLTRLLSPLDRVSVEHERNRLREELADYDALLRLIDRHGGGSDTPDPSPPSVASSDAASPTNGNGNGNGHSNTHKPLSQKRDAVLALMHERPGRWTTAEMRKALAEGGIDPHAGTPVKNILWQLSKAGAVTAAGKGVYEFPALTASADDPRVQEAMGL